MARPIRRPPGPGPDVAKIRFQCALAGPATGALDVGSTVSVLPSTASLKRASAGFHLTSTVWSPVPIS